MESCIAKRYATEIDDVTAVTELILDGCKIREISDSDKQYVEKFSSLAYLSCSQVGLRSLKNFPTLLSLQKLELQDNNLHDPSELQILSVNAPNLRILALGGNKYRDLDNFINNLGSLKNLEVISVDLNLFNNNERPYKLEEIRKLLFTQIPNLKVADGKDSEGNDYFDEELYGNDSGSDSEHEPSVTLKDFYEKDYSAESNSENDDSFEPSETKSEADCDTFAETISSSSDISDNEIEEADKQKPKKQKLN